MEVHSYSMTAPTVHIIDDDVRLCRAVTRLLRSYNYTVQSYTTAAQFLSQKFSEPACLLLDLQMPEISGLDVQQILSRGDERLPIIFVSGHGDIESSVRAMKAGAIDFLTKPFDDLQLLSTIQDAMAVSKQNMIRRDEFKKDHTAFASLTPREREVCIGIAQGLLNKQVGYELGTTEKTVKAQRARVMQKLGAASLPDIVRIIDRLRAAGAIPAARPHQRT